MPARLAYGFGALKVKIFSQYRDLRYECTLVAAFEVTKEFPVPCCRFDYILSAAERVQWRQLVSARIADSKPRLLNFN